MKMAENPYTYTKVHERISEGLKVESAKHEGFRVGYAEGKEDGRREERERIVAWMRKPEKMLMWCSAAGGETRKNIRVVLNKAANELEKEEG